MTDAERALLLEVSEYLTTLLHNARWPEAGERLRVLRLAVFSEQPKEDEVDGEAT